MRNLRLRNETVKTTIQIATMALLAGLLAVSAPAGSTPSEDFTLAGAVLGKQLFGPAVDLCDCEGRVTVFFIWGIT